MSTFGAWLTEFGEAWERADADALAGLFARGATYQATPYAELVRGRGAIREHWTQVVGQQQGVVFRGRILGVGDTYGIAHWTLGYQHTGSDIASSIDGIFLAAFDRRGLCTSFRSWRNEPDSTRA